MSRLFQRHGHAAAAACLLSMLSAVPCALADEPAEDPLVAMVVDLLGEDDTEMRALGLDQVRNETPGAEATARFAALLPDLNASAQVALLGALADRGDATAKPFVWKLAHTNESPPVRAAAIRAVGSLGSADDTSQLVLLLALTAEDQREAARDSLVRLTGVAVSAAIAAQLGDAPPPVRVILIEVLAARRALETTPAILAAAIDADPAVQTAAMTALGALANEQQLPGMLRGVLRAELGAQRTAAEKCVMRACQRIDAADRPDEPLLTAVRSFPGSQRDALLPTLGRVGGAGALAMIEAAIGDRNSERHDAGIRALCNWPDASVAPRLLELAETDGHAAHRTAAVRALIRVGPLPDDRPAQEKLSLLKQVMPLCRREKDGNRLLARASAVRDLETLRFVAPYLDQPAYRESACQAVVDLAHHRNLREPNEAEFHAALDKVIATSTSATLIERAQRYKKDQTWAAPLKAK